VRIKIVRCILSLSICFVSISASAALAQAATSQEFLPLAKRRAVCGTMSLPGQISLGVQLNEFIRIVKAQLGATTKFAMDEDDEKMIVQVPGLRIYIAGWGEMANCDFIFIKTKSGPILGSVQSDVTNDPKTLTQEKIATFMVVMGKPRASDTSDDAGAPMKSFTWNSDTSNSVIFSLYSYSDRGLKQVRQLFVVGDTLISPILRKL